MINIDTKAGTYVCPFCGHAQAYHGSCTQTQNAYDISDVQGVKYHDGNFFDIYTLKCNNSNCKHTTVVAIRIHDCYQVDLVPKKVMKHFPDYIPEQIRNDYEEANLVLDDSPKAAATLLRRCLQGMIHDFWDIHEKT